MKSIPLSKGAMYQIELALLTRIDETDINERTFLNMKGGAKRAEYWAARKDEARAALKEFRSLA